jgi:hypothetical protein
LSLCTVWRNMGEQKLVPLILHLPLPVAARSKALVCGRSLPGFVGSNPAGGMNVCSLWLLCVIRQRSLCVGLITRPRECYRCDCCVLSDRSLCVSGWSLVEGSATEMVCVFVWVWLWSLVNQEALAYWGLLLGPWEKSKMLTSVLAEGAWSGLHFGRFNLRKEPPLPT